MPRSTRLKPNELVAPWPDGPAENPIGEVARRFAMNLRRAIGEQSIRSAAEACGMNHATLIGILDGRAWPDMETIAKLERGLARPATPARVHSVSGAWCGAFPQRRRRRRPGPGENLSRCRESPHRGPAD